MGFDIDLCSWFTASAILTSHTFETQPTTMKFPILLALLGVLALGVDGLAPQQQYLITYPKDAPQSDLDDYKHAITAAGGQILHEYQLIK